MGAGANGIRNATMMNDSAKGYSLFSIFLHWAVAAFIVFLFVSGQFFEEHGSINAGRTLRAVHISVGTIAAVFIFVRFFWRASQPSLDKGNDGPMLNLLATLVQWGLLLATVGAVVTGIGAVWASGRALDVFGIVSLPSPMGNHHDLHETLEGIHEFFANAFIPLVALHVLGALKHWLINRDGVMARIFIPAREL